ncbi:hypothetical protein DPMN_083785 [Dreissena polymorpha]|uniref:Uncharacterized protein n=1 Tax=Dreissena polymorpha TaxID=45954 RepID=A0A9D4BK73_DREPO|nr:hypothetical protein DPMN_083785 [Dreissena polymorpha]
MKTEESIAEIILTQIEWCTVANETVMCIGRQFKDNHRVTPRNIGLYLCPRSVPSVLYAAISAAPLPLRRMAVRA